MPSRLHKAFSLPFLCLITILSLLLTSCTANQPGPTVTSPAETATRQPRQTRTPEATPTPEPSPTFPPHMAVDPASLRGVRVDFWHPWGGDLAVRVEELAQEFNRSNEWGVEARVHALYNAAALTDALESHFEANRDLAAASPDSPELAAVAPEQLAGWMAQGRVVSLDDYLRHPQWGLSAAEVEAYFPVYWQQEVHSGGGVQSGLPALRTGRVLFYNRTWAEELGFSQAPKTPEEFKAQACAAAFANNTAAEVRVRGTGGWLVDFDGMTTLSWMSAFGANPLPEQEGMPYNFQTPEAEQALAFLRGMFDEGCAWEGRNPTPYDYFGTRMAIFYAGTLQEMPMQARTQERLNSSDSWTVIAFPGLEGEQLIYSSGYSYGIFQSNPQAQLAAWLFARWLSQPTRQANLAAVWPSLPISTAVVNEAAAIQNNFPWSMTLPLQAYVQPAPALESWPVVRGILSDATWQMYRLPADQMQFILPQLEEMSEELLNKNVQP